MGGGGGTLSHPAPAAAPPRRGRLDIVPGRGLLAYTLYTLLCKNYFQLLGTAAMTF